MDWRSTRKLWSFCILCFTSRTVWLSCFLVYCHAMSSCGIVQWRRFHRAWGHMPPLLQMAGHGAPWVEEQHTKKTPTKLYWPSRKLTKMTNCTCRAKKWRGTTCSPHFQIRSSATGIVVISVDDTMNQLHPLIVSCLLSCHVDVEPSWVFSSINPSSESISYWVRNTAILYLSRLLVSDLRVWLPLHCWSNKDASCIYWKRLLEKLRWVTRVGRKKLERLVLRWNSGNVKALPKIYQSFRQTRQFRVKSLTGHLRKRPF